VRDLAVASIVEFGGGRWVGRLPARLLAVTSIKKGVELGADVRERAWIDGVRRGNVAAFERMVRAYGPPLSRFAFGLLGSQEDADDIVQDVLWRVWDGREDWWPTVSLRAYLFTAVRNRALNLLQRGRVSARYQEATQQAAEHDAELQAIPSPAEVFEAEEERTALTAALRRAFAGLTERQQSAVRLRYEEGLTFPEAAAALGVSLSAAEKIVARAIRVMRAGV
jgi:RNA polymerase sigma-70 factor, ECF subfamily